jgi:IclR family acetate operon transcriptional repressor
VSISHLHPPGLRPAHGSRRGRTPAKPGSATAQVQSLTRGLSILECLARAEGGLTLTDVSHRVQLPPSTAHRLLSTLERMGYVYQAGELGRWYVGLQAFAVGSSFLSSRDFVAQSHPTCAG